MTIDPADRPVWRFLGPSPLDSASAEWHGLTLHVHLYDEGAWTWSVVKGGVSVAVATTRPRTRDEAMRRAAEEAARAIAEPGPPGTNPGDVPV